MKKRLFAGLISSALLLSLAACGDSTASTSGATSGSTTGTSSDTTNVSVILKTTGSEYWGYVSAGAEAYGKEHPEVKVTVQGATSETAYDEQLNIIETNLASSQYQGVVIAPLQADMVTTKIAGTPLPIIALDTKIEAPEVQSFVGTGNEKAAEEGGKKAVELAKAAGWDTLEAVAISGVQGDSTATDRLAGYAKGVNDAGGTFLQNEIQYADAVADKAYSSMEAIIQNHPEGVSMILCNNDEMAIAAADAITKAPAFKDTVVVGFDGAQSACESILAGAETLSVAQNGYNMGYKAVETCVKAIQKEEVESFIDSGSDLITKDNAQKQLETLQGYLKK